MRTVAAVALMLAACSGSKPVARPRHPVIPGPALPAPGGGETVVGTEHPFVIEQVAPDGSWVAICQARADTDGDGRIEVKVGYHGDTYGDDLTPYLVHGGGDGEAIDALVSASRDGRWIAAVRGQQLGLLDTRAWTWTSLPRADVRDDESPFGPHRAASIAASGRAMTFFREDDQVAIRNLIDGSEHQVRIPNVWRVEVDPAGYWARVYVVRKDSDGDGQLTWPSVRTSLSDRACRGPVMSYSTSGGQGDTPDVLWLELDTGDVVDERDHVLGVAGDRLVRMGDDHVLRLGDDAIADAACDAQVKAIRGEPARVAYTCKAKQPDDPSPVVLVGPDLAPVTTGVSIERDPDWRRQISHDDGPLCGLARCVDLADGKPVDSPAEEAGDPRVEALEAHYAPTKILVFTIAGERALIATVPKDYDGWGIPIGPLRWVPLAETTNGAPKDAVDDDDGVIPTP